MSGLPPAVPGLDGPEMGSERAALQYGMAFTLLAVALQVLALGAFLDTVFKARDVLGMDGSVARALYTLGAILFVTYSQLTVYPLLRWSLAPADAALVFFIAIAQFAAARLLFEPAAWWGAIALLHVGATAAYLYAFVRTRDHHMPAAPDSLRKLRAGALRIVPVHGAAALVAALFAIAGAQGVAATWILVEIISIATLIVQWRQEQFLSGLFQELGLARHVG